MAVSNRRCLAAAAICVLLGAVTASAIAAPPGVDVSYTLDQAGDVSLGIYNQQGQLLRTLRRAASRKAGQHTVRWDGLNAQGRRVEPGEYEWRLLRTDGLTSKYLLSVGTNFRHKHWTLQHRGGPQAIGVANESLFVTGYVEGSPLMNRVSLDGEYQWARKDFEVQAPEDMMVDGDRIYMLNGVGGVRILKASDGEIVHEYQAGVVSRRFDFIAPGEQPAKGYEAVRPVGYTASRGYGWRNAEGIEAINGAAAESSARHAHTAVDVNRTFQVDVPNGRYLVRLHYGAADHAVGPMRPKFHTAGMGLAPRLSANAGESQSIVIPRRYNNPLKGVTVTDGHLRLQMRVGDNTRQKNQRWAIQALELMPVPNRLDASGDVMVAASPATDMLAWLEPTTGEQRGQAKVRALGDVTLRDNGRAIAISGNRIVEVAAQGAEPRVLADGLDEPTRLALDPVTGATFVITRGDTHQILKFDAEFNLVRRYGRKGGRRQGPYDPHDFWKAQDIAGDGKGGFVMCEGLHGPRRTAHFNAEGELLNEWHGGQQFFTYLAVDPKHRDRVWFDTTHGWIIEARVDYDAGTWKPLATYRYDNLAAPRMYRKRHRRAGWTVRYHGGDRYLIRDTRWPMVLKVNDGHGPLQPVVSAGRVNERRTDMVPDIVLDMVDVDQLGWRSQYFIWQDANRNGRPARDEIAIYDHLPKKWYTTDDLTYFGVQRDKDAPRLIVHELPVQSWQDGVPRYPDFDNASTFELSLAGTRYAQLETAPHPREIYRDEQGRFYAIFHSAARSRYQGRKGAYADWWPASTIAGAAVLRWNKEGAPLWDVGALDSDLKRTNGRMHFPTRISGKVHGNIGIADRLVNVCEFWTRDGLYIGGVLDKRADDGLPDRVYHWWRKDRDVRKDYVNNVALLQYDMLVGGALVEEGDDSALFFGAGWNNSPVYRITGWDRFSRQRGTVTVTADTAERLPHASGNGGGLRATYFNGTAIEGEPIAERTAEQIRFDRKKRSRPHRPWPEAINADEPFSARWTGRIEPRFSETYQLLVLLGRDGKQHPEKLRIWVDGKLKLDTWTDTQRFKNGRARLYIDDLDWTVGERVPLRIEYGRTGAGSLHLCWISPSQAVEHVPATHLHPSTTSKPSK